jgi:hypothetical protein
VYDDVINEHNVTNPDQVKKATARMELSFSLGVAAECRTASSHVARWSLLRQPSHTSMESSLPCIV